MSCDSCSSSNIFSPKAPIETVTLTFDFSPALGLNEFIQSIVGTSYYVISGEDATNDLSFVGEPFINISGVSVQQQVTGGLINVGYRVMVLVMTTQGQELACAGTLTIEQA